MNHFAKDMTRMKWCVIVTLMSVLSACGADTGPAREGLSSDSVELREVQVDSVFVSGVGMLPKAEVYRRLMNYRQLKGSLIYGDQVINYAKAIIRTEDTSAVDSLLVFAERFRASAPFAVGVVVEQKSSKFPSWLKKHAEILDSSDWRVISATVQRVQWRDSTVMALLMEEALHGEDVSTRAPTVRTFNGIGTLSELRTIAVLADTTVSRSIEERALAALTRFDVPEFNRRVRSDLQSADELSSNIEHSIEQHRRYDFLPELRAVDERLGPKMSDYDQQELQEIITYLEEKKAEGAPHGVPLDWPETTWEELEREGSDANTD